MPIPIYQVDAFAERPFSGNPAAVCILETPMPEAWMQSVATEMNLAETAFIFRTRLEQTLVGVHVLIAAAGEIEDDEVGFAHFGDALDEAGYGMGGFERGNDAFGAAEANGGGHGVCV